MADEKGTLHSFHMALPTYDELLAERKVTSSSMEQTFADDDLQKFSLQLDKWEKLARFMGIPNPGIENIKSQGDMEEQKSKMLVCWKQRFGSKATYKAMAKVLLQIGRTDLAEIVISFRCLSLDTEDIQADDCDRTEPNNEPIQATPPSPGSSSGIGEMSPDPQSPAVLSPYTVLSNPIVHTAQQEVVISQLRELEEEFYELVTFTEDTLTQKDNEKEYLKKISRRFSMLPPSIRRQHQTDENYIATRQRILSSKGIKELFDNLTALKHWSYMMPDTLAHIVQDVKIDDVQQKIDIYRKKLTEFKTKTELKDMIGLYFAVPDYCCIELMMEVDGWEDKTLAEAEMATMNILRKAAYSGGIRIKAVNPGSTIMVFIFLEPTTNINIDGFIEACKDSGVICIQIDEEEVYKSDMICDSVSSQDSMKFEKHFIFYKS